MIRVSIFDRKIYWRNLKLWMWFLWQQCFHSIYTVVNNGVGEALVRICIHSVEYSKIRIRGTRLLASIWWYAFRIYQIPGIGYGVHCFVIHFWIRRTSVFSLWYVFLGETTCHWESVGHICFWYGVHCFQLIRFSDTTYWSLRCW